ncbi:hypothetical protein [Devosia salina]|uniref:PIN domain-containing protein n=1 Tax=Devosia salina TaxID=2860336 RepID=A0ABX8WGL5_9HYPH|nr:hypothetical protein [Devosia salina]QYO77194.1 hypothetical protein K1X15_00885 [Devosia salina]
MSLPEVNGWLIDYRTAHDIFSSGNNQKISHCVELCVAGTLFCCFCEKEFFNGFPPLKSSFIAEQDRVLVPDERVLQRALAIADSKVGSNRLKGNDAAVFLAATALENDYGVISDHTSIVFSTIHDIGGKYGIPVFSSQSYFAGVGI